MGQHQQNARLLDQLRRLPQMPIRPRIHGKDTEVCGYFRNNFLQLCHGNFVKQMDEQRENKVFPSQVYSRSVKDSFEWEPKHEAWKINAEAGKAREAEYRDFFQSQK